MGADADKIERDCLERWANQRAAIERERERERAERMRQVRDQILREAHARNRAKESAR
jgi:hypothetical protein